MVEKYIETIRPYVLELFKTESSGHDISHLERTTNTALYLQKKEGGDRVIIGLSAFLHDVHRVMENEVGHFVSPEESLDTIRNILSHVELTEEQVEKICYCVVNHEIYNWNGNNVDDINTLVLQDADNLDAIGAIGVARAFSFGGAHSIGMYDPAVPLNEADDYSEGKGDVSTIHHFYHKAFKLAEHMNTKTARELAEKKNQFMKVFVEEFMNDWNAIY